MTVPAGVLAPERRAHVVRTMGTVISIDVRAPDSSALRAALDAAEGLLHDADATFSTYRTDSFISRLARRAVSPRDLPPTITEVLGLCAELEELTDGWFSARWRGDGSLDPTGVVKGWAAEAGSRLLTERGFADHCINAAGDVVVTGRPAEDRGWRIGISDPRAGGTLLGVVEAPADGGFAVATSGVAERGLHITDPRTGRAAEGILSATVAGPVLSLADGLATALVAAGPDAPALLARWRSAGWRGCIVPATGDPLDPDGLVHPLHQDGGATHRG